MGSVGRLIILIVLCLAVSAPAAARPKKGVLLRWWTHQGASRHKQERFPTLEACEQAGLVLTLRRLTEVYGERDSYDGLPKKPVFLCEGPCVEMNGNSTFCPIVTFDGEQGDRPGIPSLEAPSQIPKS